MAGEKDLGSIVYEVDLDTSSLIKSQREVTARLDSMDRGFENTGRTADKLASGMSKVGLAIVGAFTIQTAKRIIDIADNMTMLQARVTRLSASVEEAKETMSSLSAIAANTGSSLASTEKLWETLTASLKEAGATNSQVLMLTDTLQKIGVVGGSSAEEMSNALRQFGQSIAGGIVRAEEFNSVLENMPELARQMAAGLGISLGELRKRMLEGKLTAEDALNAIQKQAGAVNTEFEKMPVTVDRAKNSLDVAFKNMIGDLNNAIGLTQTLAGLMQTVSNNLNFYNKNVGDSSRMPKLIELQKQYNDQLKDGKQWYETDTVFQQRRGQAAFELKRVEEEIAHIRAKSAKDQEEASKPIQVKTAGTGNDKQDKLVKASQRRIELSKLEGEARARLQAQYDAEDAGISKDDPVVKKLQDQYAETERNTKAQKASNAEGKQTAAQAQAVAEKLADLQQQSQLSAESTQQLSREQAILRAEQSLGKAATSEQVQQARDYAAAIWDTTAALKAQNAVPELKENADYSAEKSQLQMLKSAKDAQGNLLISQEQFNQQSAQLEQDHQTKLAQIRASQAVSPQQEAAGMVDPVQQLANENAKKLALIQQFEANKTITEQQGIALRNAANTQYEKARTDAMWQIWSQQSTTNQALAASFDSLAGNASNAFTGIVTGSMTTAEAMQSLLSNAINSLINGFVQMGVEWVKSAIMGQTAQVAATAATTSAAVAGTATTTAASVSAATATTVAWTPAAIVASIGSFGGAAAIGIGAVIAAMALSSSIAGKRKNGGPVSAGSMYQVGEGGMPEIYQSSSGRQYMIPGDNGSVISNKDMQSGGSGSGSGINVNVNITNTNGSYIDQQVTSDGAGGVTVDVFIADMDNGGPMSQAVTRNTTATRRATA